jgi:dipeptidase D
MDNETRSIINIFEQISAIPRQSKHEEKIAAWLRDWAAKHALDHAADSKGNVVIRVPASPGCEDAPVVILQGHMDMVCEKTPGSTHDFSKDAIKLVYDGDWITATDTTLGADNGIAVALALAAAETDSHPRLELLMTVDEETGLTGANALGKDFVEGRILLNLDSEDQGVFTIGCAGGKDALLSLESAKVDIEAGAKGMEITVGGLVGGHSGVDIHRGRANANKLLSRVLASLIREAKAAIVSISGGSVRNAIPRDARAIVAIRAEHVGKALQLVEESASVFQSEYHSTDRNISLSADPVSLNGSKRYTNESGANLIHLLRVLPNGPREYSADIHGLVETSSNMAVIEENGGSVQVHTSQRSSVMSQLDDLTEAIVSAGTLAGASVRSENSYPPWTPRTDSELLRRAKDVYVDVFSKEPKIEAIHAGLECGVIGAKYPGMDMISFGPTIRHAHSPDECVNIPSIESTWKYLKALLTSFI